MNTPKQSVKQVVYPGPAHLSATDAVPYYRESNSFSAGIHPECWQVDIYDLGGPSAFLRLCRDTEEEANRDAAFVVELFNSRNPSYLEACAINAKPV